MLSRQSVIRDSYLLGVNNSSQVSAPKQESWVAITASPNGTVDYRVSFRLIVRNFIPVQLSLKSSAGERIRRIPLAWPRE